MVGLEITEDDVRTVLDPHGILIANPKGWQEEQANDTIVHEVFKSLTKEERAWIGEVEGDVDEMTKLSLARLEEVLRRKGVITSPTNYFNEEEDVTAEPTTYKDYFAVKVTKGKKPEVLLAHGRNHAAYLGANMAEKDGVEHGEAQDSLGSENGEFTYGDTTIYVIYGER